MTSNRRAERPRDQLAEELAAIKAMSRAVNATLSLNDIATAALSEIVDAVRPDLAFLFLCDGDRLNLMGVAPPAAHRRLGDIPKHCVGECICGLAVHEKQSLFSRNILADRRCAWEMCKRAGIVSLAAVPLTHGNDVIGVVGLASDTERDFGGQGDFLETLAGLVASALVNARLYETAQRELAERARATDLSHESE